MQQIKLKLFLFFFISFFGSSAFAVPSILFNLDSQHFSTAIAGGMTVGRYDLGPTFVSTNLNFVDGSYTTEDDTGYFKVEVKDPIENWNVTVDAWYVLYSSYSTDPQVRSIVLTSENGETLTVSLKNKEVMFDSVNVYSTLESYQRLSVVIKQSGTDIALYINGSLLGTANRPSFAKLKFVNVQLIEEYSNGSKYLQDDLFGLIIGSQ